MNKEQEAQDVELLQADALDETLIKITAQPKRRYTQQEIDEARENLALMNDRVFLAHFIDNKNNFQPEAIETMKTIAGMTDSRLAELKQQALYS